MYKNEDDIGQALAALKVDRDKYFVVTKLLPDDHGEEVMQITIHVFFLLFHNLLFLPLSARSTIPRIAHPQSSLVVVVDMRKRLRLVLRCASLVFIGDVAAGDCERGEGVKIRH